MPIVNSFTSAVAASAPALGRSTTGFEFLEVRGALNVSKSISFSVMPVATEYATRLVVLTIGCYFNSNEDISAVSYGSQSLTRAVASASSSDKGACEIWYAVIPTNPASNVVTVTGTGAIDRLMISREILSGLTSSSPYDTDIDKVGSDFEGNVVLNHPTNGITLVGCLIWKDGITNVNCTWTNATESGETSADGTGKAEFSAAYYESATGAFRSYNAEWIGILDANIETVGASWR